MTKKNRLINETGGGRNKRLEEIKHCRSAQNSRATNPALTLGMNLCDQPASQLGKNTKLILPRVKVASAMYAQATECSNSFKSIIVTSCIIYGPSAIIVSPYASS